MRPVLPQSHHSSARGFTLVEIMVVVVIVGLLAALAVPSYMRVRRATQNNRVANDFRVFAQAFEIYNTQNGFWPNNIGAGKVPTGPVAMNNDFKTDTWTSDTTIGGQWNWDKNKNGITASISITGYTCDDDQLTEIDAKIDDGNLATGNLQKAAPDRISLILEL